MNALVYGWFWHPLRPGDGLNFYSGIGSDIGELTLISILWLGFRRVNCSAPWCPKVGLHPTADGQHHLCGFHHPDHPSLKRLDWLPHWVPWNRRRMPLEAIHEAHRAAKP